MVASKFAFKWINLYRYTTGAGKPSEAEAVVAVVDPRDVSALRSLADGLASACRAAGERRVLRRVVGLCTLNQVYP
jgi:hypothetical protein